MTNLEYPHKNESVWLYDGSVPYFQRADHIVLGIFAILVLIFLFLPYTLLLLCGHRLHACSHWKSFSWVNKLKPFLDAYHAPYKKETRYWTGFLLVVRCILLLVFGLNAANINLLVITTFMACLLALVSLHKGIYETTYNNILEIVSILNLCIFSAVTYHVKEIGGNQAGLAYTFIGIAFFIFLLIMLLHAYSVLCKTSFGKKLPTLNDNFMAKFLGVEVNRLDEQRAESVPKHNHANRVSTTSFTEERKPLLAYNIRTDESDEDVFSDEHSKLEPCRYNIESEGSYNS